MKKRALGMVAVTTLALGSLVGPASAAGRSEENDCVAVPGGVDPQVVVSAARGFRAGIVTGLKQDCGDSDGDGDV